MTALKSHKEIRTICANRLDLDTVAVIQSDGKADSEAIFLKEGSGSAWAASISGRGWPALRSR